MKDDKLHKLLDTLITAGENEVIEFKRADKSFDTDKIGDTSQHYVMRQIFTGVKKLGWFLVYVTKPTRL